MQRLGEGFLRCDWLGRDLLDRGARVYHRFGRNAT